MNAPQTADRPCRERETIRWAIAGSALGPVLVAATERGLCRLSFDEGEADLCRRYPCARLLADGRGMAGFVAAAQAAIERPGEPVDIALDLAGTGFQQAVWNALRSIPAGETRTYAQIAAAVGRPGAVRAAGSANGANPVSVVIPCHRVIRSDGALGGYAWGLDRKRRLLDAERKP